MKTENKIAAASGTQSGGGNKKRFTKKRINELIFIGVMMFVPILHFCVFTIYMNLNTVVLSFQTRNLVGDYVFLGNPFQNYVDFFDAITKSYSVFPKAVLNSLYFFVLNDVLIVPLTVVLTYFLYKKIFMSGFFRVVFYLPCIISMVVMVMVYRFMFDGTIGVVDPLLKKLGLERLIPEFGWMGTKKSAMGLVTGYCIWAGLGGNLILLLSAMTRVPEEIVESAKIDGIGFFRELFSITIPLIGTTLATLYMMGTTVIFTFFLQPKLITNGGPEGATTTIMMYIVDTVKGDTHDLSGAATVGMVVAVFGTPLVLITRKIVDKVFPAYES